MSKDATCNVPRCTNQVMCRGLCSKHYWFKKNRDPEKVALFKKYADKPRQGRSAKKTGAGKGDEPAESSERPDAPSTETPDPTVDESKRTERADGRISAACEILRFFGCLRESYGGGLRFRLPENPPSSLAADDWPTHLVVDNDGTIRTANAIFQVGQRLGS